METLLLAHHCFLNIKFGFFFLYRGYFPFLEVVSLFKAGEQYQHIYGKYIKTRNKKESFHPILTQCELKKLLFEFGTWHQLGYNPNSQCSWLGNMGVQWCSGSIVFTSNLLFTSDPEYSRIFSRMQNHLTVLSTEINKKAKLSFVRLSCRQQCTQSK